MCQPRKDMPVSKSIDHHGISSTSSPVLSQSRGPGCSKRKKVKKETLLYLSLKYFLLPEVSTLVGVPRLHQTELLVARKSAQSISTLSKYGSR